MKKAAPTFLTDVLPGATHLWGTREDASESCVPQMVTQLYPGSLQSQHHPSNETGLPRGLQSSEEEEDPDSPRSLNFTASGT